MKKVSVCVQAPELERCPFCGCRAKIVSSGELKGLTHAVRCYNCGGHTRTVKMAKTAVKLWNTRADVRRLVAQRVTPIRCPKCGWKAGGE